ncbi:DUF4312 family protein [Cryobacterium lactosi]|uniref:DUF4312 family protein n=1 Tax=Cryobacterium lactosi TaxID=1259202 RepID=UPI00141ABAE0|nr:DUF4312 family protein [Cryobacterium lactosi]
MKTETVTTSIVGKGDTKERALSDVFRQVPQSVREKVPGTCFRIQPVGVEVSKAVEFSKREKFLGVLFARTRIEFSITAVVVVEVSFIDLDDVAFTLTHEALTVPQHLLQLR